MISWVQLMIICLAIEMNEQFKENAEQYSICSRFIEDIVHYATDTQPQGETVRIK